jgi:LPS O-antigen subunit length determinant protein (WzzB/FepE family)
VNSITRFDPPRHDEIDLVALTKSVWRQKRLIALVGLLCASLAGLYAFTATKEYEVESVLRPIAMNELDAINRSGLYKLSPKTALMRVAASLDSYETRLSFYRNNSELFEPFRRDGRTDEQVFDGFNRNSLKLDLPDSKTITANTYIGLKLTYAAGVDGVRLLNGLVAYAIETERQQVVADVDVIISNRTQELERKLLIARETYETNKQIRIAKLLEGDDLRRAKLQDELKGLRLQLRSQRNARIAQLDEAISIAEGLGITKPTTPSALGQGEASAQGNVIRTEVNNQQIPLYFMGAEALKAERQALRQRSSDDFTAQRVAEIAKELQLLNVNREIEMLQARKNEDFFLKDVESYRAELIRLRNLGLNLDQLKLVSIDRLALEPLGPVKPRKVLIILLGLIVGVVVGVAVALMRHVLVNHRSPAQRLEVLSSASPSLDTIKSS